MRISVNRKQNKLPPHGSDKRRIAPLLILLVVVLGCLSAAALWLTHDKPAPSDQDPDYSSLSEPELRLRAQPSADATPKDWALYYYLVADAYKETDKQKALYYLLEAEKQTPDDKNILYAIAELYSQIGDKTKQAEYETKAGVKVQTGPNPGQCDVSEAACN